MDRRPYVGIFELLEPLVTPEMKTDGATWKLRIADLNNPGKTAEAEFHDGSASAKVRGKKITLSGPAHIENRRLLLPLHGIGGVLIPLLATDLIFHESSQRMFLGGVAELISSELHKGEPSTLALHFPQPVNPSISSEGNSLKFSFSRDPVISLGENEAFNDKLFNSSSFAESNGTATLTINGTGPLLARFADDGKTIIIAAAPALPPTAASVPAPAQAAPPTAPQPNEASSTTEGSSVTNAPPKHPTQTQSFLVVIDPGHGGNDAGARITPDLPEKDLTLALARKLRQELQSRHISSILLRDGDIDVSLTQRAISTNLARPSIFIGLHAEPGSTLRIYTPALPSAADLVLDRSSLLPWQIAQGAFVADSRSLATTMAGSLRKRAVAVQVRPAFLQPLRSIAAPAIAVEAPAGSRGLRISQELIAGALAEAIAARKSSAGGPQ